jgi:hypothetical protein
LEIHKPKPWHGFREFLKEYLIIVVGVLTALGAEQAVEWAHRRQEVAEAREALRAEIELNLRIALAGEVEDRCWLELLDRRAAWANGGAAKPASDAPGRGGGFMSYYATTWDVAKSGAVAHMPLSERTAYARFYGLIENQNSLVARQRDAAARMERYVHRDRLTPDQARLLVEETDSVRGMMVAKVGNVAGIVRAGGELGVRNAKPTEARRQWLTEYCRLVRS